MDFQLIFTGIKSNGMNILSPTVFQERLERQEKDLRQKILRNIKAADEKRSERQREILRGKLAGTTKLRSTVTKK